MHIFYGISVIAKEESCFDGSLDCSLPQMETSIKKDCLSHGSSRGARFALVTLTRFYLLIAMANDDGTTCKLIAGGEPTWRKCERSSPSTCDWHNRCRRVLPSEDRWHVVFHASGILFGFALVLFPWFVFVEVL